MLHAVDQIVYGCIYECVMLALWYIFATDILSTVRHSRGKVYKVMNIKDVFLKC